MGFKIFYIETINLIYFILYVGKLSINIISKIDLKCLKCLLGSEINI